MTFCVLSAKIIQMKYKTQYIRKARAITRKYGDVISAHDVNMWVWWPDGVWSNQGWNAYKNPMISVAWTNTIQATPGLQLYDITLEHPTTEARLANAQWMGMIFYPMFLIDRKSLDNLPISQKLDGAILACLKKFVLKSINVSQNRVIL